MDSKYLELKHRREGLKRRKERSKKSWILSKRFEHQNEKSWWVGDEVTCKHEEYFEKVRMFNASCFK